MKCTKKRHYKKQKGGFLLLVNNENKELENKEKEHISVEKLQLAFHVCTSTKEIDLCWEKEKKEGEKQLVNKKVVLLDRLFLHLHLLRLISLQN